MNLMIFISIEHQSMSIGDALFASTALLVIGVLIAVFIKGLLTLPTED